MKKIATIAMAGALALSLVACGGSSASSAAPAASAPAASTAASAAATDLTEISAGMCQTPAILTSIGQSADVDIANTL